MFKLSILECDQVGVVLLDLGFECGCVIFVAQLDRDHGRAVFVEEALRGGKRHEDSSVFKAVGSFQNAYDVKGAVTDGNATADAGVEKVSCARTKDNVVVALAEEDAIAGQPCGFANTGIVGRDPEAGDDGVIGARNYSEQNGICVSDGGPGSDFAGDRSGNIAEKKIGDVALEDNNFTVVRENARKHANGALKNGDHGEHGGDTEGNAGNTDQGADAVTAEIGEDQLEEDHGRSFVAASSAISQALSVTWRSSLSRSLRRLERNDKAGR